MTLSKRVREWRPGELIADVDGTRFWVVAVEVLAEGVPA